MKRYVVIEFGSKDEKFILKLLIEVLRRTVNRNFISGLVVKTDMWKAFRTMELIEPIL